MRDLAFSSTPSTIFEGFTNIASSGMFVERPDGSTLIVPPFTDIFTPTIDFVTEFRYVIEEESAPIPGEAYTFTLLDPLGNPIEGTTTTDVFYACLANAPSNASANVVSSGLDLDWDDVAVTSSFNPPNGLGFYQVHKQNHIPRRQIDSNETC